MAANRAGVLVPAGLFIGIGLGFLFDQVVAGVLIGLGAGFLGLAVLSRSHNP